MEYQGDLTAVATASFSAKTAATLFTDTEAAAAPPTTVHEQRPKPLKQQMLLFSNSRRFPEYMNKRLHKHQQKQIPPMQQPIVEGILVVAFAISTVAAAMFYGVCSQHILGGKRNILLCLSGLGRCSRSCWRD